MPNRKEVTVSELRLDAVSKSFGGLHAVSNIDLVAPQGSITGLIGPNGAGKTTIINLITGTLRISSGRVFLDDVELTTAEPDVIARRGVSRTFQNIRLLPEASVLDNVIIGFHRHERSSVVAGLLGLPSSLRETRALRQRGMEILKRFRIERFADAAAGSLAYGHQRRVEMARAVAAQPRILLLDEPVAGMNDVEADELGDLYEELAASGIGLLMIEHNVRFVTRMCTRIYAMASGKMIAAGPPGEVLKDPNVITAYLGDRYAKG
ncbi:Amino acid/amide ABC transporter ATP-binding protein 1 (HAAT family) [Chelatococcus asaccharovorans]|nr:Amino acid/amide ABC transporter ATP-binding protein 1 (HAAT family) [Chelatococcus asaccharovorans]CAH1685261.1 Amino acid/amide ABC transporter ATP-binding protein 1 (HAAT family) [Chelatococcus asaccharovorans]